jgi:hypothetical protein
VACGTDAVEFVQRQEDERDRLKYELVLAHDEADRLRVLLENHVQLEVGEALTLVNRGGRHVATLHRPKKKPLNANATSGGEAIRAVMAKRSAT